MSAGITRRQFYQVGASTLLGIHALSCAPTRPHTKSSQSSTAALLRITKGKADLVVPPSTPSGETWRYGLAFPFQVAPDQAAVFCNIKGKRGHDFEEGTDVILFNSLSSLTHAKTFAVSRNHQEVNPNSRVRGQQAIMVKYPVGGGFVPLGAKRSDGSAHPYAGTGFGVCEALAWTTDHDHTFAGDELYSYLEVQQYSYDGTAFKVLSTERFRVDELLPGSTLSNVGIATAIPDGDDLLFAMAGNPGAAGKADAARPAQTGKCSGVVRWTHQENGWVPKSFHQVTEDDHSFEPTLIRDLNGSLLLCARGAKVNSNAIRVWRSRNGGGQWEQIIHVVGAVAGAPISINQAVDGTPYIASNLFEVLLHPVAERFMSGKHGERVWKRGVDSEGRVRGGGWHREKLCLWPLSQDRSRLETPVLARDTYQEFGPAPTGDTWNVDHPSAKTVRLADGRWHNIMALRICDHGEVDGGDAPAPQSGTYLEEVMSNGTPVPAWTF